MTFKLAPLPFARDELKPYISEQTLSFHYDKHHQTYVTKLNDLIVNSKYADKTLEEIIKSSTGVIFNNAAQVWNHSFYWQCLSGDKSQQPSKNLTAAIEQEFGSVENMLLELKKMALANFGSGWTWLVVTPSKKLKLVNTSNAACPLTTDAEAILTCDIWEHAYYLDTQNNRAAYLDNFCHIICWDFVSANYNKVMKI